MSTEQKYTPHKWAEAIKAWADGKPIQYRAVGELEWKNLAVVAEYMFSYSSYEWRAKPEKKELWVNIYPEDGRKEFAFCYPTRERADEGSGAKRIACIKVEYEEGEGL